MYLQPACKQAVDKVAAWLSFGYQQAGKMQTQPWCNNMMRDVEILRVHAGNRAEHLFLRHRHMQAIRMATHPILLTKSERNPVHRRVLLPVNFTAQAKKAAQFVLGCWPRAQVVFLHVFHIADNPMHEADPRSEVTIDCKLRALKSSRENMSRFIAELHPAQQLISGVVHHGSSHTVVSDYAARMRADLIVIDTERTSWLESFIFGSAAWHLAKTVDADVLAVPSRYRWHHAAQSKQPVPMSIKSTCLLGGLRTLSDP